MNKFLLFIVFSFNAIGFSQSIGGSVIYGQKLIEKANDDKPNEKKSPFDAMYNEDMKRMDPILQKIDYTLTFNELEASFESDKIMPADNEEEDLIDAFLHVNGDGVRYYSSKTKIALWQHDAFDRKVILIDTVNIEEWKITNETKKIGQYIAFKATKAKPINNKNFEITAWFTPEIPYNYGPLGYYGLPGLILELYERNFVVYAKKIKLNLKNIKIIKPSKGLLLSDREYKLMSKKAYDKLFPNN
jgi:GLPGLI family protein